ncbi:MAG: RluA family pseudouridine synthase [Ideonella sp.]|nr:RluA family pseudouridine synthase [Ideonella sp.]
MRIVECSATLIVIDKPSGLPAVPGRASGLQDCVASRVQAQFADALVVHRLDMATSGLMLMARGLAAQRALGAAFERRAVDKRYVAVVAGLVAAAPAAGWAEISLPLAADWPARPRQKVDQAAGKPSLTRVRVLAHRPGADAGLPCTRVELQPLTGRTHQLRVHLAAIGHPIVGDALYAPPEVQAMSARLLLHASALALADPVTGQPVAFASPAPF